MVFFLSFYYQNIKNDRILWENGEVMNKELLQERKKMIYDFICDELYVPMKAKEMAIVLNVPKSQRGELLEVLDALTADGKVEISGRGKICKIRGENI